MPLTERLTPDDHGLTQAADLLHRGELVAFGTETVYGLGADATNEHAVATVFEAKGRPHFNPLIIHYADPEAPWIHAEPSEIARRLARVFWPGPLTMVLPRRPDCRVSLLASAGLDTLAVRVPDHAIARRLLSRVGLPIAAPSANRFGEVSPTTIAHVLDSLGGRIAAVLDSGPCVVGVESTVLDLTEGRPFMLRPGGVPIEAIEALIGPIGRGISFGAAQSVQTLRSPGLLASHYAPLLPVRLEARWVTSAEALLAFGISLPGSGIEFNLSLDGDLTKAAARLFAGLRWLDSEGARLGLSTIAVMAVPERGLGVAINDRLTRAAAPR